MFDLNLIPKDNIEQVTNIAKAAYEVVRAYSSALRENPPSWEEAEQYHRDKAIAGVALHILYPELGPSARHDNWMADKLSIGWTYGKTFDAKSKKHHCLKPIHLAH